MTMPFTSFAFVTPLLASLAVVFTAAEANAQLVFTESVALDFGLPSAPTDIGILMLGTNVVAGRLENESSGFDPDAFSFQVPGGLEVSSLSMTSLTGDSRFLAVSEGALSEFIASENLFTTLISQTDVGTNILSGTLNSFGGSGAAGRLGTGSYSVWFQETDGTNVDYSFTITAVSAASIPEPNTVALLFSGAVLAGLRRHRRGT